MAPSKMSVPLPIIEIHFLNKGALLRSHPVSPPNRIIGDIAVPKPNKTATAKLSIGLESCSEYRRSMAIRYGHMINPLLKPKEKARKSNLVLVCSASKFVLHS
jgi:hypothetical protein